MSYIRCLCNPESLYVYGGEERHEFSWTDHHGEMRFLSIPNDDFDGFFREFRKWDDGCRDLWHETFEYKGIKLRTVTFDEELKRVLSDEEIEEREKVHMMDRTSRVNHLICLTYGDYPPLLMWEVTWDRLRNSAYDHLFWPCWFVRKINKWFGHGDLRQ